MAQGNAIDALGGARYISLETFKKDGNGVKTPVWSARVGQSLYVFTDGTSFKVKRISRNPKANVAECNASGAKITSAWFEAKAEIVDRDSSEEDAAYVALRKKYGLQMKLLDVGSRLAGRIGGRKVIRISFS